MSSRRPIEFKSLSMMALRSSPGEIIDRVARKGKTYIIERNGQQLACLLPVSIFLPDVDQKRILKDREELDKSGMDYVNGVTLDREIYFKFGQGEITIEIVIPNGYPSSCPRVYAHGIDDKAPHRWRDGSLCIFGVMDSWNPGTKSLLDVFELAQKWLRAYGNWKKSGEWKSDNDREETT